MSSSREELITEQKDIMSRIHFSSDEITHEHPLVQRLDEIEAELARLEFKEWANNWKGVQD